MNKLNTERIDKPFIDGGYYTDIFKPNKNAMIVGSFNNVDQHLADFDAFRQRASELVDRMLNNKVTEVGGIDFVSPTPQMFIKKATAAIIQHWYISGYVTSDLDNTLSIGTLNVRQLRNNETFRKLVPLDALALIQKTGMWDNRVLSVDVTKSFYDNGIDPSDIMLLSDALKIFQQKGHYDDNFHVDIDFSSELTGTATDRWIKIVETTSDKISFEITGGSETDISKALIVVDKNNFLAGNTEAYIYSQNPIINQTEPNYFVKNDAGTLSFYVKVKDNITKTHFLISNIYADEAGDYKLLGSVQNSVGLTEVNKANILQAADLQALQAAITKVENDIQAINGQSGQITQNSQDITKLKTDVNGLETTTTIIKSQQQQTQVDVASLEQRTTHHNNKITSIENTIIKKDGSVAFDNGYTPSSEQSPATKKYTDDEITKVKTIIDQKAGYMTEWEGSKGFIESTDNTNHIQCDISNLQSPSGQSFDFSQNHLIRITLQTATSEDTSDTRIGNNKWDNVNLSEDSNDYRYMIKVSTSGILTVRSIDHNNSNAENKINPSDITVISLHQITGNVYSTPTVSIDDTKITELEGVTI